MPVRTTKLDRALTHELLFLIGSQIFFRGYLLLNPVFLTHLFPELSSLQALLSQFDSFGTVFGTIAATTYLIIQQKSEKESGASNPTSFISMFFWLSNVVSLLVATLVVANYASKAQELGLDLVEVFVCGYMGTLSSVLVGLLSGALIQKRKSKDVFKLILAFYVIKLISFSSIGFLHPSKAWVVFSIQITGLVSSLFFLFKYFGWDAFQFRRLEEGLNKSYFIYLSENFIGFIRALTPFVIFLLLSQASKEKANYPAVLTYSYLFASLCNVPVLACMPLALRMGLNEGAAAGKDFFARYALIPTLILFGIFVLAAESSFAFFLNYHLSHDEKAFVSLFTLGCGAGLIGHYYSIGLRVHFKSQWLALSFLATETILQIALVFLLVVVMKSYVSGVTMGAIILAYASFFSILTYALDKKART